MASARALQRLQVFIWVLIYGGLLTLVLGIATQRAGDAPTGWLLLASGGTAAAAGVALIAVRARLRADTPG